MDPIRRPSVFISYNQADRAWAEWIAWTLEENGYTAVIQAWDIRTGSNFVLEMNKAAAETDKTLAVLSESYLRSGFTQPEWAAAFARDPKGRERTLIPVRVAPCSPDGLLAQVVWTDLFGASEAVARARLLQAFAERGKPLEAPAFPGGLSREVVSFPGDPPIHNLPYPRLGDLFTGRQEELAALAGGGTAAITQSAAISGLGGIGKTRLAVEAIDEASFGNEHPDVATDLNNLAYLLQTTNRLEEAEPLMRRAVDILEKSLGPDHPKTQSGRKNLARLLAEMGQEAGAADQPEPAP